MRTLLTASALLALRAFAAPVGAGLSSEITLRVVNEGGIDSRVVSASEKRAGFILGKAGLHVTWLNCAPGFVDWSAHSRCAQLPEAHDLDMRIVVNKPRETRDEPLGFTTFPAPSSDARPYTVIYYPAIERMAWDSATDAFDIAGAVMAHEIGHMLLGSEHAAKGLMSAKWRPHDVRQASVDAFLFSSSEAALLRAAVERLDAKKTEVAKADEKQTVEPDRAGPSAPAPASPAVTSIGPIHAPVP